MELQEAAQQARYTANMAEINVQEQTSEALLHLYAATEEVRSTMSNLITTNVHVIKEMLSVTVIASVYSLLQQNRNRSTQGQSAGGLKRALKT
eukprot:9292479-Ditylum_brightwellii.AAC.1